MKIPPRYHDRADAIKAKIDIDLIQFIVNRAAKRGDWPRRFRLVYKISDHLAEAAIGQTPCQRGCSHCCNIDVLMTHREAQHISQKTGRPLTYPFQWTLETPRYFGVPCPFLKDNECGIYDYRPFACRIHYSVEDDDSSCRIEGGVREVAYLDILNYNLIFLSVLGWHASLETADIRDFFPEGK